MNRKIALVTGAAKGIGEIIAKTLVEAGYDLGIHYHSNKERAVKLCNELTQKGACVRIYQADISKVDEIKRMFDQFYEDFGGIDLMVNNAGISSEASFLDITEEFFDKTCNLDWKGTFFCAQLAAKNMVEKKNKGVIINIASNQAEGCWPNATVYAGCKGAVVKFTKNSAMELAKYGIRVVAIAPGYTEIFWNKDSHIYDAIDKLPLKRFADRKEIADAVVYLASDAAGYITGTCLTIDGGATLPVVACNEFVK
ncbi:MAG: SDR family oxidoreductase [Marinisporobacter sp.]|nr:SDR family oxidoreductase [Marinisporobacter sp.]